MFLIIGSLILSALFASQWFQLPNRTHPEAQKVVSCLYIHIVKNNQVILRDNVKSKSRAVTTDKE